LTSLRAVGSTLCAALLGVIQILAQVQAPLRVEAFGGVQSTLPPISVPPELKSFVPSNSILRAVLTTNLTSEGERIFLYDNGEDIFPSVNLRGLRNGREFKLFDGTVAGIAGLLPIKTSSDLQLLGFAYHQGGDQSDTRFVIFAHDGQGYRSVFQKQTTQGRIRILPGSALRFEMWDANAQLDPKESCVWCPHRYRVLTYEVHGSDFKEIKKRTTREFLDPGEIAAGPFVVLERNKH
jgi:hypothetical protein